MPSCCGTRAFHSWKSFPFYLIQVENFRKYKIECGRRRNNMERTMTVRKITTTCLLTTTNIVVRTMLSFLVRTNFSRRKTSLKIIDIFLVRRRVSEDDVWWHSSNLHTRITKRKILVRSFFVVSTILGWLMMVAVFHLIIYVHYICKWNAEIYVVVPWWNYNMWMFCAVDA